MYYKIETWVFLFLFSIQFNFLANSIFAQNQQNNNKEKNKIIKVNNQTNSEEEQEDDFEKPVDFNKKTSFQQPKFVPDISFIVDLLTLQRNYDDETFKTFNIPEFTEVHTDEDEEHSHGVLNNGMSLNYAEVALYSVVDPYFDMLGIFHLSTESFEIEEAFVNTTSLPFGFKLKFGKFKSSFGRINERHAHVWNFIDKPLIFATLQGGEGLNDVGAQINWLAPSKFFFKIGAEVFKGENEACFGTEGFETYHKTYSIDSAKYPNSFTAFIKTSFDIGNLSVLNGFSTAFGKARINHEINEDGGHGIYADTYFLDADITLKYQISSYKYVMLQSEYLYRNLEGDLYLSQTTIDIKQELLKRQGGFYTELVIKPLYNFRFALRYEMLQNFKIEQNNIDLDVKKNLDKTSFMIDYHTSEFALFRLQYNFDRSKYENDVLKKNHEILFQCNLSVGAHGAHSF